MDVSSKQNYEFGQWRLDPAERLLLLNGEPIPLTAKVFDTLLLLVENAGSLVTKDEFMKKVWPDAFVEDVTLAQNISQLRKALGDAAIIETVPKKGYRFLQNVRRIETGAQAPVNGDHSRSSSDTATSSIDPHAVQQNAKATDRLEHGTGAKTVPWGWIIGGASLVIVGLAIVTALFMRSPRAQLIQFDVELKSSGLLGSEVGTDVILSPDGTRVVFLSIGSDGVSRLNTRRLDQSQVIELAGTEGARVPFFSPDGLWVGFLASGKLKKTAVEGGAPVVLCDATDVLGASWGEDGQIVAALGEHRLSRIPASGGPPTVLVDLTSESATPMWPQVLPGNKLLLFTSVGFSGPNHANIEVLSLATGKRNVLVRGGTFGRYLPDSYVTYVNQGTLFALPFDQERIEARGAVKPVLAGVSYSSTFGYAELDFSRTGVLVYRKSGGGQVTAQWLDSMGKSEPMLGKPGGYLWPRLSPNGKRVALSVTESGEAGTRIYEGEAKRFTQLSSATGQVFAIWTPDGGNLILGGARGLSWVSADGTGTPQPLTQGGKIQIPWSFSPDGSRLAYHELNQSTGFDLWTVPVQVSANGLTAGKPEPFLQTPAFETYPAFSPDGHWIAYGSNESGSWQVYVRSFPDAGKKTQISTGGGRIPRWSPNGRELLYRTDDQRIMAATYSVYSGSFVVRSVRRWSQSRLADTGVLSNFDLSPDGQRVLALMPATQPEDQPTENHVTFMLNFSDEVRQRLTLAGR